MSSRTRLPWTGFIVAGLLAAGIAMGPGWSVHADKADPNAACAPCHRAIYERYRKTPMALASGPADEGFIPADFVHAASGVHYRVTEQDGHGVSLFRMGRAPQAIPFLEKARAAVQSANIDPDYVLALCYADVQRYDDARHAFAAQFGFAPDGAQAHLLAGRLFLRRELRDEAGIEAAKALAIDPNLPLAHDLLGEVALARGDVPGAVKELKAERKLNPLDPDLFDRLGDVYLRNAQYTEAQQALDRAVLLEPNSTGPYILLGETFLKLNDPIQALHYLDHAVRMDSSNYITHNLLGQAYKAIGRFAEANREFKTVVELQHQGDSTQAGR